MCKVVDQSCVSYNLCKYVLQTTVILQPVGSIRGAMIMYSAVKPIFLYLLVVIRLPMSWQQEQCQEGKLVILALSLFMQTFLTLIST